MSSTAPTTRILEVEGLSARYGHVEALRPVDLHVDEGELVAVLGPNGAGKSTLMNAIMGLVPTQGQVRFRGRGVPRRAPAAVAALGIVLVPEGRGIFAPMTVAENLELGAYLLNDKHEYARRHARVLAMFPRLKERLSQTAGSLSGGEQQMLAVGRGLMLKPRLLMLDEPSLGLAPVIVQAVFRIISEIRRNTTVLLVEQNARMGLSVADHGYVLETGRIVLHGKPDELWGNEAIRAAYLGGHAKANA